MKRAFLYLTLVWAIAAVNPLLANTYTVDSPVDASDIQPGDGLCSAIGDFGCTLRAAVEEASANPGADTILIPGLVESYKLTIGPLVVSDNRTSLIGLSELAEIDGYANTASSSLLHLASDSNSVENLTFRRSRSDGILIEGSYNLIGGQSASQRVTLVNNGLDFGFHAAIRISGENTRHNVVSGCLIGLFGNGTVADGNDNGIIIDKGAAGNLVGGDEPGERNLIAGNDGYGIVISGGHDNRVTGNWIGIDASGEIASPNKSGGVLLSSGASGNMIGTASSIPSNYISGNGGHGVTISNIGTRENLLFSNVIGTDISRRVGLPNDSCGVLITNSARANIIGSEIDNGGNQISSNLSDGISIRGANSDSNKVAGNLIGLDDRGRGFLGNGTVDGNGIRISDGARFNYIGGPTLTERNTISAHYGAGVYLEGTGTSYNKIAGNHIGTDKDGRFSVPNGSGLLIRFGASNNVVGGVGRAEMNIISGNRLRSFPFGGGVVIYDAGTNENEIVGNYIGTDSSGARKLSNATAGVIVGNGAQHNRIGGEGAGMGNVISGNGYGTLLPTLGRGIHIYGAGTDQNIIQGNIIGLAADSSTQLDNFGHGIAIIAGAFGNFVGGTKAKAGNIISSNNGHGIFIADINTQANRIRYNSIFDNDSSGIALVNSAQGQIVPPTLTFASVDRVDGINAPVGATVDLYRADPDPSGAGEGFLHIGSGSADQAGAFSIIPDEARVDDTITAIVTDPIGNSSAFSVNIVVSSSTSAPDDPATLPFTFELGQNYPNPFNPSTRINYSIPTGGLVRIEIYNALGRKVATVVEGYRPAGSYEAEWDGNDFMGKLAATGHYFYRLSSSSGEISRKMLLLR
ncbi:MAG: T9SS type A sorting domain-containing protein [candidate division Zixibacteria bacterium]